MARGGWLCARLPGADALRRLALGIAPGAPRDAAGQDFPIIIKTVVHRANFRLLPEFIEWADAIDATAVNFQPMDEWTPETREELWIPEEEHDELEGILKKLVSMKRGGARIMNSDQTIELILPHFRKEKAPPEVLPCRVKETVECDRLCLFTCLSQKTLRDKVRMGLKLIAR